MELASMTLLPNHGDLRRDGAPPGKSGAAAVKMEMVSRLEEEEEVIHAPLAKRSRISPPLQQIWSASSPVVLPSLSYNLIDEPSPLGLRLKKSPSLLELIQLRLSRKDTKSWDASSGCMESPKRKDMKSSSLSCNADKMKASNFPAALLRIGSWEYVSKYEGDLVAKCYYAKHKLVWEVLEGGLKSKIEIQWSDISALRATCSEVDPGRLDIVLFRQPLFFKETNPQPRKHTLWQATSDFTGGQASIHRRHFLQCPPGLLNRHFEKLIQCDPRLYSLSQIPCIIPESPYFEPPRIDGQDGDSSKCRSFGNPCGNYESVFSRVHETSSSCRAASSSMTRSRGRSQDAKETPSPSSATREREAGPKPADTTKDRVKVSGFTPPMFTRDLAANHLAAGRGKDELEELTQYLLDDNPGPSPASDELPLMTRVNSLCCLLQKDVATAAPDLQPSNAHEWETPRRAALFSFPLTTDAERDHTLSHKTPPPPLSPTLDISRKDSFGKLLMHLPQIVSSSQLPHLFFNVSEDVENQAR